MNGLATLNRLNYARDLEPHPLAQHPRIQALRRQIREMGVPSDYMSHLYHSLYKYADQIVERPVYAPSEGLDDLEALQQVTLEDMMGRWFKVTALRFPD
jgi:hypothetical protein